MATLRCPSPEQLKAFHLGDLPEEALDEIAQHLDVCPRCETLARQLDTQCDPILKAIRAPAEPGPGTRVVPVPPMASPPRSVVASGRYAFLLPPTQPGDLGRLANYRVLRLLGAGGMGYVFHAEDVVLRRPVALKVMKPNLTPDADGWQRFAREARVMASIKHRNLVTIYQAGEENGAVYLAMELLEGETLGTRLDRLGVLAVPEMLRLGREIAGGLAAIHAQGLVHRDIKPDNIWLDANDAVKILDFGLARCLRDTARLTQTGVIMGTPAYMSPEQAAGRPVDSRSDLFSLGVLLYRACSGKEPFAGQNTMAVLAALAVATARPLHEVRQEIPRPVSDLVARLLARDPNRRPGSAQEVVAELQALGRVPESHSVQRSMPVASVAARPLQGDSTSVSLPALPRRKVRRPHALPPWAWFVAGSVLALVLVAVALMCWQPWSRPPAGHTPPADGRPFGPPDAGQIEPVNPDKKGDVVYLTDLAPAGQLRWYPYRPPPPDVPPRPGGEARVPVSIRGKLSPHGIFMHGPPPHLGGSPASVTYRLPGEFRAFEADVSLNDGPPVSEAPITFVLYDQAGRVLWRSRPVESQQDTQRVSVPLEKVETLRLEIDCGEREPRGAHAVWVEPRLVR